MVRGNGLRTLSWMPWICLCACLIFTQSSSALTGLPGEISGTVLDANSHNPIGGATVTLHTGQFCMTDSEGEYVFPDLYFGSFVVWATALGYHDSDSQEGYVDIGSPAVVDFELTLTGGDEDCDGIPNNTEGNYDPDGDTIPNYLDSDSDDDGYSDAVETAADPSTDPTNSSDTPILTEVWVDTEWSDPPYSVRAGIQSDPLDSFSEAIAIVTSGGTIKIVGESSITRTVSLSSGTLDTPMTLDTNGYTIKLDLGAGDKSRTVSESMVAASKRSANEQTRSVSKSGSTLSDDSGALKTSADSHTRLIYEPLFPNSFIAQNLYAANADSILAIRLRSDADIEPGSIWGPPVSGYTDEQVSVEWLPVEEGNMRDVWVLFKPQDTWYFGEIVAPEAGGSTISGKTVEVPPYQFQVESAEEYVARIGAPAETIWQPQAGQNYETEGNYADTSNDRTILTSTENHETEEPLPGGVGTAFTIGPMQVYEVPQRVWLPVPEGYAPEDLHLYYYHPNGPDKGWYPAEQVEGWLVPDSFLDLDIEGSDYLGFLVRHAGIVHLRAPTE